jgi:hypothetical protein
VIVSHTYNQVERPFILGVLPEVQQETAVNADNNADLVLRDHKGATMSFTDSEQKQKTSLHTQDSEHGLFFSKRQEDE